jgi:class 3 adenylate cyclase
MQGIGTTSTRAVVFCDVVGSTEIRSRLGDVAADPWFDRLMAAVSNAVFDVDGLVVKSLGDGVMAVFTSASAALHAAVAIQQAADAHEVDSRAEPAHLRVGVSIGDVAEADGDWSGLPVVEAARLCAAAGSNEIYASDVVRLLAGSRTDQQFESVGALELKGLADPVSTVRVLWLPRRAASASTALPAALATAVRGPFVGRDHLMSDCFDEWKSGVWRGLLVAGEPGIGKTRFVAELCNRMAQAGASVVAGRCDEDIAAAYRPWTEALEPLVAAMSTDELAEFSDAHGVGLALVVPVLRRRVPDLESVVPMDAQTLQGVVVDDITAFLTLHAASGPLVVVLDDVHWIDASSLVLLRRIAAAAPGDVSLIATYRDTDLDRVHPLSAVLADLRRVDGVRRVALQGLDATEVEEYLTVAAGHALDADGMRLADAVHEGTAGNPLFVGEVLRHLSESGAIRRADDRWVGESGLALPEGLREVIGRRLTRLGDDVNVVLRVAAVLGRSFDAEIVESVVGHDVLDELELAADAGIIVETGRSFEFRHAVLREVLLAELSATRLQRMHRDVAEVLDRRWALSLDLHIEELAHHHAEGCTANSAQWCLRAAHSANDEYQSARAVQWADRGLELVELADTPDLVVQCDLAIAGAFAQIRENMNSYLPAKFAFDLAAAIDDHLRMVKAALTAGTPTTGAVSSDHLEFLQHALDLLHDDRSGDKLMLELSILQVERVGPHLAPSVHAERSRQILDQIDPDDPIANQIAWSVAASMVMMNQHRSAQAVFARYPTFVGRPMVTSLGLPVERLRGHMQLALGDREGFAESLVAYEHELGPRLRFFYIAKATLLQSQAMAALLDGNWARARELVDEIDSVGGHDGNVALGCTSQRAWIGRETGRTEQQYQGSRQLVEMLPDFPVLRALLAGDAAEAGHHDIAAAMLDELAPDEFAAVGRGWLTTLALGNVAWAAIAVDARPHAPVLRRLLGEYEGTIAVIASGTNAMCSVDRLLGGLAALDDDHAEADRLFAAALAQEEGVRSPPLAARSRHWWARAMIRRGDTEQALPLITAALETADRLGMQQLSADLRALATSIPTPG